MIVTSISPVLKLGLQLLGVWPDVPYSFVYWLTFMSSIVIMQYCQYMYIFGHLKMSELTNLVDSLPVTLDYSLTIFKLISLWIHRRILHEILAAMDDDWRECIGVPQYLHAMTIKANISHFCSNAILGLTAFAAVFYLSGDYVIRLVYLDSNDTSQLYPIKIQFPFEIEQKAIFVLFVVTLFLHVMLNACTISVISGLIITLVFHVGGQIDIICEDFKTLSRETVLYKSSASTLAILIERHKRVILFSDNIERLFSFIALMQVVWNTLVICSLGFIIIISIQSETGVLVFMKTITAYFAIMIEAFMFCFAGEYLSFKGKSIADAAYESLWFDMPSNQCKIIITIIMRSQRPLAITAGKMMDMSFEAFTSIMKASASYMSVLYAMY